MHIDDISKSGAIEIEVKYDGETVIFKSEVIDIINNSILVTTIKVNDQTIGFTENCQINFLYVFEDKLHIWEHAVIKLVKYNREVYHMIDISGEGIPYNRRNSYRIYIGQDMPLSVNTSNGPVAISVLVKDISETGVGFITKEEFAINQTIRLKLTDDSSVINLSGIIVRKEFLENLGTFLYGCKFSEKNPRLGRYLAKKQNELLRKKSAAASAPLTSASKDKTSASKEKKAVKPDVIVPNK